MDDGAAAVAASMALRSAGPISSSAKTRSYSLAALWAIRCSVILWIMSMRDSTTPAAVVASNSAM